MPIIKSAKKRVNVSARQKDENMGIRSAMKNSIKKVEKSAGSATQEEMDKNVRNANKAIDKAVNKGIMKKNTAARQKSRIAKIGNSVK